MKFRKNTFEEGKNVLIAKEVKEGDILALKSNKYFYVDDIDSFFINNEVAMLYPDDVEDDDIQPHHSTVTFYNEDEDEICNVPGDALIIVFRRVEGSHNRNTDE